MLVEATRLVPNVHDIDTAGFWEAARRHELVIRACASCGSVLHMPRSYCRICGSFALAWRQVPGTGALHSWTVVEHQVHAAYPVPYTLVLVDVDGAPGARLVGHLAGRWDLHLGQPMEVWFDVLDNGVVLPQWTPRQKEATGP